MLKEKCKQYDDEIGKNRVLEEKLEKQSREIEELKSNRDTTRDEVTLGTDTPVSSEVEKQGSTSLVIKDIVTLLDDNISSPFTKPQNKYGVTRYEENEVTIDLYEGIVEALYETKKDKSDAEIQEKYEELLRDLVEKMPCDRNTVVKSLRRAFKTVMPDFTFEDVPKAAMKCSASPRNEERKRNNLFF